MGGIVSCVSNIIYLCEKLALYIMCTGLIFCLVLTITVTLGIGIGLGYNYCFVDMKIRGHYIYPGSSRWPYKTKGDAMEEPLYEQAAEENALRKPPQPPDISTAIPDEIDLRYKLLEYLHYNNTGNGTGYYPTFPDSESFNGSKATQHNGTESSVVAATNTEISEDSSRINSTSTSEKTRTSKSSSVTEVATKITEKTNELTPEPPIADEEKIKSSPSHRILKKLVIPISGMDLISLLSKLKAENRNYSLQVVTT